MAKSSPGSWKLLLPPWHLGGNVKRASDEAVDDLSDGAVAAEWFFAAVVIAGVIGEFIIAARHPPYDSRLGQWGPAFGDLLVALGVAGEVLASVVSHLCQGELTRRSNEKLAKIKEYAVWRTLTNEERGAILQSLRATGIKASVRFSLLANDPESLYFAGQLAIPFHLAGWKIGYSFESYAQGIATGVLMPDIRGDWTNDVKEVHRCVRKAFISANVLFVNGWPMNPYMETTDNTVLAPPWAYVYVGPKPMPHF
jgi:hypothetical protein